MESNEYHTWWPEAQSLICKIFTEIPKYVLNIDNSKISDEIGINQIVKQAAEIESLSGSNLVSYFQHSISVNSDAHYKTKIAILAALTSKTASLYDGRRLFLLSPCSAKNSIFTSWMQSFPVFGFHNHAQEWTIDGGCPDRLSRSQFVVLKSLPKGTKLPERHLNGQALTADIIAWLWTVGHNSSFEEGAALLRALDPKSSISLEEDRYNPTLDAKIGLLAAILQHRNMDDCVADLKASFDMKAVSVASEAQRELGGGGDVEVVLRTMFDDLRAWRQGEISWGDIDRSIILHGPPGVGKTFLVEQLAKEYGFFFEYGSVGLWEKKASHEVVHQANQAFMRARSNTPSILMIDELDSFMTRSHGAHNETYLRHIVNGMLTLLEPERNEGVIVVGATNALESIDEAIKRPGRFDRIMELKLPSGEDLVRHVKYHLHNLNVEEIRSWINQVEGYSPAEIATAAREVKGIMRRKKLEFSPDLFISSLKNRSKKEEQRIFGFHNPKVSAEHRLHLVASSAAETAKK